MVNNLIQNLHFPGSQKVSRNPGKFRSDRDIQGEPELYGLRGRTVLPTFLTCATSCVGPAPSPPHDISLGSLTCPILLTPRGPALQAHTLWKALLMVASWAHIAVFHNNSRGSLGKPRWCRKHTGRARAVWL